MGSKSVVRWALVSDAPWSSGGADTHRRALAGEDGEGVAAVAGVGVHVLLLKSVGVYQINRKGW